MEIKEQLFYAYFAGCIDCDGTIGEIQHKTTKGFIVNLTQHERSGKEMTEIAEELRSYGYRVSLTTRVAWAEKSDVVMYNINIKHTGTLITLLQNLIPHLRFKKSKAESALSFLLDKVEKMPITPPVASKGVKRFWTKDEEILLVDYVRNGYTNTAIAIKLERSTDSISRKLTKLGVTREENL